MTPRRGARRLAVVAACIGALFLLPGLVTAHAELVRAIPADGEAVTDPVTYVSGRYTEDLTADSSLQILDASGVTIATGRVDPDDDRVMIARPDAPLTNGTFTIRSTAISQVDGHPERATWTFSVAVPASPTPTAVPSGSAPPSSQPTPSRPTSPSAPPSPSLSPGPTDPASSVSDVALPIIAALAVVLIGAGALLRRGRRPGPS